MRHEGSIASTAWSCSDSASMCSTTRGWPKRWCKRPSSSSASRPEATTPAGARCGAGCSRWPARPPYDIARRPSSRPFLPVEDFQLPPQYDTVDKRSRSSPSTRPSTSCPSIYADVMRLVRDGLTHSEIAERARHPGRHRQIPDRPRRPTRCGPSWPACEAATMLSERDIELAHPEAFDFVFGNLPAAKRAEFNRHLSGCRYCQGVVDEYSEIGRIIKQPSAARRAASRPRRPDRRRHARCPRRPARQGRCRDLTPRTKPPPGPTRYPGASLRPSPRPGSSQSPSSSPGRGRGPAPPIARRPAGTGRPEGGRQSPPCRCGGAPSPPGRHSCRRRRDHHRRDRRSAQPRRPAG